MSARWLIVALVLAVAAPAFAQQDPPAKWSVALEPYLWLAGVDGTLKYEPPPSGGSGGPEIALNPNDLKFPLMLAIDAHRGKWGFFGDFLHINLESGNSGVRSVDFGTPGGDVTIPVGANAETSSTIMGTEWELAGTYTVLRGEQSVLDVVGGIRSITIGIDTTWKLGADVGGPEEGQSFAREGTLSKHVSATDLTFGVRGRLGFGGRWFVPILADVGVGTDSSTWQVLGGIGYRFGWGDLALSYRYLTYSADRSKVLDDVRFSGFLVGARFTL